MKNRGVLAGMMGLFGLTAVLCGKDHAAGPPAGVMRLPLWPAGVVAEGVETESDPAVPTVDVHLPPAGTATGAGVVVLPGGGYGGVSMDFEAVESSKYLNSIGVAAFEVRYRHAPRFRHPLPLQDACRALRLIRSRAAEFGVDPHRLGLMGFSAGGHLASSVITLGGAAERVVSDPVSGVSERPDFCVLVYPVISFTEEAIVHKGSRSNLTADKVELYDALSTEKHVLAGMSPVFLVHGGQDKTVPPENSLRFAEACRKAGVPVELHLFSQGEHGFRDKLLRDEAFENVGRWIRRNGWLAGK